VLGADMIVIEAFRLLFREEQICRARVRLPKLFSSGSAMMVSPLRLVSQSVESQYNPFFNKST
jgi:hypothetical protein